MVGLGVRSRLQLQRTGQFIGMNGWMHVTVTLQTHLMRLDLSSASADTDWPW